MGIRSKTVKKRNVAVVGARGYSGLELSRLLLDHPEVSLTHCFATQNDWKLSDFLNISSAKENRVSISAMNEIGPIAQNLHTVFLATPAEVSMKLAPELLTKNVSVIDLSGAFRLPQDDYERAYGHAHTAHELISKAEFGLLPWAGPLYAKNAPHLIANPGCYATSVFMALIPLLKSGLIRPETLVIDSKSGASGAGRKAAENLLFTEVEGECLPYKVGRHQHLPEICHHAKAFTGVSIDPMLTTHLLPVSRGIISGLYARLLPKAGLGAQAQELIATLYRESYSSYPLVRSGASSPSLMSLKRVTGTAQTQISYSVQGDKLYVFSVLDNLMKGAATQAIENLNRLLDLPLTTGLLPPESQEQGTT